MNNIAVLGTGMAGNTIATKCIQLGHKVKMGSRAAGNEKAKQWVAASGTNSSQGTFEEAVLSASIIFNCTKGENSLDAIQLAGIDNFNNKIVIDISNPLDFSNGMPPSLIPGLSNNNSLGEAIQKLLPDANVVKTLNIVNCEVMINAAKCNGDATMFVAGNNEAAKMEVKTILDAFGWKDIIDLGGIQHARSLEMMLPIWLSTYMATKNGSIGFKIVR